MPTDLPVPDNIAADAREIFRACGSRHVTTPKTVKIVFELDRDPEEESFPPVSAEILNAKILDDDEGVFMIDNTPFFVEGIALDDRHSGLSAVHNPARTYDQGY